jgi:hypothetical protein
MTPTLPISFVPIRFRARRLVGRVVYELAATLGGLALWGGKVSHQVRSKVRDAWRAVTSTLLELAGGAAAVVGCYQIAPWLGWLAGAAILLATGWMLEPPRAPDLDA